MIRLIIVVLALLQEAAEKHRAEYHQKISAYDDHYDRDEKHKYRAQGLCYHNGGNICADEQNCASDAEKRVSFRRLLAEVFTPYQSHRARAHYLAHGVDEEEQEDNGENADGQQYCSRRDMENIADISAAYRLDESEFGELREHDAEHKTAEERFIDMSIGSFNEAYVVLNVRHSVDGSPDIKNSERAARISKIIQKYGGQASFDCADERIFAAKIMFKSPIANMK